MKISEHVSALFLATLLSAMPISIQANEEFENQNYQQEYVENSEQGDYIEEANQEEYVEDSYQEEYVEESYGEEELAYSQGEQDYQEPEQDNDAAWEQEVKAYCQELASYELPEYQKTYLQECIDSQLGQ